MLINVATLIQEPIGHDRRYRAEDEVVSVPDEGYERRITGTVRLIRSERGVLVSADLDLSPVEQECARCLEPFETPLHLAFDEEYVVSRDPATGLRIEADQDDFRIDGAWHLDLSEAVRQYEASALPIRPVCRPDCRGLCPVCGQNLNHRTCDCGTAVASERWGALATLAEQLRQEDHHGRPEA